MSWRAPTICSAPPTSSTSYRRRHWAICPEYTVATLFEPAFAVAGDFYDHYPVPGGLNISVADVMGKGLGPAIVAANVRSALRAASRFRPHRAQRRSGPPRSPRSTSS